MHIKKIITVSVTIDSKSLYSGDIDDVCLNILRKKYVGVCFKSCFITAITQILRRSRVRSCYELTGNMIVDVTFLADAIVYFKGEVLTCVVKNFDAENVYRAEMKEGGIAIDTFKYPHISYKTGDEVLVRVFKDSYSPMMNGVSVLAYPFVPMASKPLICSFDDNRPRKKRDYNTEKLVDLLKVLADLKKNLPDDKERVQFFKKIMYPYKNETEEKGISIFTVADEGFDKSRVKQIIYDDRLDDFNSSVMISNAVQPMSIKFNNINLALMFVTEKFINYYRNLNSLMNLSIEKIKNNQDAWKLYSSYKIS